MSLKRYFTIVYNPFVNDLQYTERNFSYERVEGLIIPENQQMVVFDEFTVDGELDLYGRLVLEV